jgi:hypothetical protein
VRDDISVNDNLDDDYIDDDDKGMDFLEEILIPEKDADSASNLGRSAWRRIEQLKEMRELHKCLHDDVYEMYDDFDD